MNRSSTLFLKGAIVLLALFALFVCLVILPIGIRSEHVGGYLPILLGMYVATIPFFAALYQGIKLLTHIDHNEAFSDVSVTALTRIKYCAAGIGIFYILQLPYIYIVAERDDAPGVIVIGLVVIFASLVVATFSAVLQKILQNAIDIKQENDLTV